MVKSPLGDLGVNIHGKSFNQFNLGSDNYFYFSSLLTFHFVALDLWSSGSLDAKVTKDQDCLKLPIPETENLKVYKLTSLKQYKLSLRF